ncbi:MAG: hypothetical protein BWY91_02689 [bacterium ADurb.BinA028]|nr:MAG: hypothetical protein BWY91_02689 [bacterium ADurb.BinA028]
MSTWNTALRATSTAAISRSPHARSFHNSTMAMHRANPTRITPVRYAGWSPSSHQARANITRGPTTQLSSSDAAIIRRSAVTRPISS